MLAPPGPWRPGDPEQSPRGPFPTRPAPTCVEQPKAEQQQQQQRRGRRRPEPGAAALLSPGGGGGGGAGRCCSHAHARPCRARALRRGRRRGRGGWAGPLAAAWAGGRASLPPLLPFRPASESSHGRRKEPGVAGGGRWPRGADTSRRSDAAGRAGREERYKDGERAPEAAAGARAAGPPAGVGSARVDRPDLTSRGSQRPGELRTRGLRGQSISVPHSRPAPSSFHQSAQVPPPGRAPPPLPIGCKRVSRPRTALTQVPRPPPAGGAASLRPSLLPPASLGFFSSTPFPPDHGFLVPNRKGRQRLSLGPRSRRTGL